MIDHVSIEVSDFERSKAFYEAALEPLGIRLLMEFESNAGFGKETEHGPKPFFWVGSRGRPAVRGAHIAFGVRRLRPRPRWKQHRGRLSPRRAVAQGERFGF